MNMIIFGATSAIAMACIERFAAKGANLLLVGRDAKRLDVLACDVTTRFSVKCCAHVLHDVNNADEVSTLIASIIKSVGSIDLALIAYAKEIEQETAQNNPEQVLDALNTNALSVIRLATLLINQFEAQQYGHLAIISSVAGDRGRKVNYLYGAAKGLLSTYMQGLAYRFYGSRIYVTDIKPGFVKTPMTKGLDVNPLLMATPDQVAKDIVRAIDNKKTVVYTPGKWRWIMLVMRILPNAIFFRLGV